MLATSSTLGKQILEDFNGEKKEFEKFVRVIPHDYKNALLKQKAKAAKLISEALLNSLKDEKMEHKAI